MKRQTMVARSSEIGIAGPALSAMIGKAKMTLLAGAMWVMAWKTSSERPRELARSWGFCGAVGDVGLTSEAPMVLCAAGGVKSALLERRGWRSRCRCSRSLRARSRFLATLRMTGLFEHANLLLVKRNAGATSRT